MSTKAPYAATYTKDEDGNFLRFDSRFVFVPHNDWYKLTELRIRENGEFEFQGKIITLDDIISLLDEKRIVTKIPEGSSVSIPDFAGFYVNDFMAFVEDDDFVIELEDILCELKDEPTTSDLCRAAFDAYKRNPNECTRNELANAYSAVPAHLACWLLGAHEKDGPIARAISEMD